MRMLHPTITLLCITLIIASCSNPETKKEKADEPKVVRKYRDDGTLSSMQPVDEDDFVHGVKVRFYEDGRTVHSKVSYEHGVKQGPAIWYYKSGKVFEHTNFKDGRRDGLTKKYHKNGKLLSECQFRNGDPMPGLVEYLEDGSKVKDYPSVTFSKTDKLAFENRVILEIKSSVKSSKVKYFFKEDFENAAMYRNYLEVKAGKASIEYYVAPGHVLMKTIEIYAELPTKLGNTLVKEYSYALAAKNR